MLEIDGKRAVPLFSSYEFIVVVCNEVVPSNSLFSKNKTQCKVFIPFAYLTISVQYMVIIIIITIIDCKSSDSTQKVLNSL